MTALLGLAAPAAATPKGAANWSVLTGECGDAPALLLDPQGGNTAFLVEGSVGVAKGIRITDLDNNVVLVDSVNGSGVATDRLISCSFVLSDVDSPAGNLHLLVEAEVLFPSRNVQP